jgi:hypothetical protein
MDICAAHEHPSVTAWLAAYRRIQVNFTPMWDPG